MTGWIGISLGDITGIGPEVTLKALATEMQNDQTRYLLIGDAEHARALNERLGLKLPLQAYGGKDAPERISLLNPLVESLPADLLEGSPAAARAAIAWLKEGAERCLRHELDALVTAPVNKETIVRAGMAFIGQTEFLSQIAGTPLSLQAPSHRRVVRWRSSSRQSTGAIRSSCPRGGSSRPGRSVPRVWW